MKRVYRAAHLLEAERVKDLLLDAGIEAHVHGALLTGALGELPVDATPEVWIVDDDRFAAARAVVADYEARLRGERTGSPWRCPRCGETVDGELDLCWSCGEARPPR